MRSTSDAGTDACSLTVESREYDSFRRLECHRNPRNVPESFNTRPCFTLTLISRCSTRCLLMRRSIRWTPEETLPFSIEISCFTDKNKHHRMMKVGEHPRIEWLCVRKKKFPKPSSAPEQGECSARCPPGAAVAVDSETAANDTRSLNEYRLLTRR